VAVEVDAFPIEWDDPVDAGRCWEHDPVHLPNAMTPLEFELGIGPFIDGFGWGMRPHYFNYYVFYESRDGGGDGAPAPRTTTEQVREGGRNWRDSVLPEVLEHTRRYREADFDSMANEELIAEIEKLPELRFRSGRLHTASVTPHWLGMSLLVDTYKELTGGDELGAMRLVQGHGNKSFEAGEQLWQVSRVAAGTPIVAERLAAFDPAATEGFLAGLRGAPDAAPFVEAFDSYLEEYGWRGGGGFSGRTWHEDPSVPLSILRSYLQNSRYDPNAEQRRLAEERDAFVQETITALDEQGRERLRDVIDAALEVHVLSEDHNFYIDQRLWNMPRRLVMAAGRRLVSAGALVKPDDVFFLRTVELRDSLRGQTDGLAGTAARRKEEFAYWKTVTPPRYVGKVPAAKARSMERASEASASREPVDELRGLGASAGVVTGVARIVMSLNESDRVRPGDVLVTPVTQPAWTPLFGVVAAVVTEVGGRLGHTAIAAREYAIPAVVAVPNATRLLRDGQLLQVDGAAGIVRVIG
jgi:rifampicin phosphotransferase